VIIRNIHKFESASSYSLCFSSSSRFLLFCCVLLHLYPRLMLLRAYRILPVVVYQSICAGQKLGIRISQTKQLKSNLMATTLLGSPCRDPIYNAAECTCLYNQRNNPRVQSHHSSLTKPSLRLIQCRFFVFYHKSDIPSIRVVIFSPHNCTKVSLRTTLNTPSTYHCADIVVGLKFAQEKNIRLVIKNTGISTLNSTQSDVLFWSGPD
jgi:hypothetical protein